LRGGYALILRVGRPVTIAAGRRTFSIDPGVYVYSGSALGLGGVEARVRRHMWYYKRRGGNRDRVIEGTEFHWHIDRLLPLADSFIIVHAESKFRTECLLATILKEGGMRVVRGFGSTDCRSGCGGHLLYVPGGDAEEAVMVVMEGFNSLGIKPSRPLETERS